MKNKIKYYTPNFEPYQFSFSGMGTKIEHSINLLATSVDSNNNFSISGVDVWEHYQKKGLSLISNRRNPRIGINKFKDPIPMDRNNIDSIKKTMQMHEDIFKHQVINVSWRLSIWYSLRSCLAKWKQCYDMTLQILMPIPSSEVFLLCDDLCLYFPV